MLKCRYLWGRWLFLKIYASLKIVNAFVGDDLHPSDFWFYKVFVFVLYDMKHFCYSTLNATKKCNIFLLPIKSYLNDTDTHII